MTFRGKGFFTWKLTQAEGGYPTLIAATAKSAGLSHVMIKIADGEVPYLGEYGNPKDYVTPTVEALRREGIQVWGWHYVYGDDPISEADIAIQRVKQYNIDLYAIDAEIEYKAPGRYLAARRFMNRLRASLPDLPIALCSYRYPSLHPELPWKDFLEQCDYSMPQVYWKAKHDPAYQLERCYREYQTRVPSRPLIPVGAAFHESGWQPTVDDVQVFLHKAQELNLSAVSFWEWTDARSGNLPGIWEAVRDTHWPGDPVEPNMGEKLIAALNARDTGGITSLYLPTSVHITAGRTVQGSPSIHDWYTELLNKTLPQATFQLAGFAGSMGNIYHMSWTATSPAGRVENGQDTLGLLGGKIAYHYSFFTVIKA
jgi:hypothetical protein